MINFCEHRIVAFSLKFFFRGHCIILKSYNQWGMFFSWGGFVSKWWVLHVGQHGIWWGGFKKTNGMGGTLAHKSEWCFWTIWTIWTIWDSCSMFFPQVLFFFCFLLCVLYIGFYAWAWAQPFSISSKYLWFLGKKLHELGKIVNNCNLETYRGIKINNLRADSISPIVSLLWKRKLHTGRNFNHRHTRV